MTIVLGTEEHPGHVRTVGYGVGVRQYFENYQRQNTTQTTPITPEMMEQLTQMIKAQIADELRCEFDQRWQSMSQQHNVEQEDDEEEVIEIELSYKCRLYVGEVPSRLVAIERLYPGGSTMHTVQMSDDLARVVVEDIKDATSAVPVPTEEVKLVAEALGTFISWPKQLVKVVATKKKVYYFSYQGNSS